MILTPAAPNAGPTGGEGLAWPPRTKLYSLLTSFAISWYYYLALLLWPFL